MTTANKETTEVKEKLNRTRELKHRVDGYDSDICMMQIDAMIGAATEYKADTSKDTEINIILPETIQEDTISKLEQYCRTKTDSTGITIDVFRKMPDHYATAPLKEIAYAKILAAQESIKELMH